MTVLKVCVLSYEEPKEMPPGFELGEWVPIEFSQTMDGRLTERTIGIINSVQSKFPIMLYTKSKQIVNAIFKTYLDLKIEVDFYICNPLAKKVVTHYQYNPYADGFSSI